MKEKQKSEEGKLEKHLFNVFSNTSRFSTCVIGGIFLIKDYMLFCFLCSMNQKFTHTCMNLLYVLLNSGIGVIKINWRYFRRYMVVGRNQDRIYRGTEESLRHCFGYGPSVGCEGNSLLHQETFSLYGDWVNSSLYFELGKPNFHNFPIKASTFKNYPDESDMSHLKIYKEI